MRLDDDECRRRLGGARHGYLATAGPDGGPHVVPVTFALVGTRAAPEIVTTVDHKPKTTTALRRLRNLVAEPRTSVLADRYDDDWARLWWVRADGVGAVDEPGPGREAALDALAARYPQYRDHRPTGPVIRVRVRRWIGWAAGPPDG